LNCLRLLQRAGEVSVDSVAAAEQAGLEFLLDAGLAAMARGEAVAARDLLRQAAEADALRAHAAWGALSWLAETTGYAEEAFRFVEQAVEADPEDAWSAYQRGRLLLARDDLGGAREALIHALDLELDFPDALIALAQLAWKGGEYRPADLYLERALSRDPSRAEVHALRGTGLLHLGDEGLAAQSFEAALAIDAGEPLAALGQAWLAYRHGDSERAIGLFAELDDRRRALPEDDAYRVFAKAQIERLRDHESKVVWSDAFERRELRNDWQTEEGVGPLVDLLDGALRIQGDFRENGLTRVVREYAAPDFVAVELSLTVRSGNNARVGLFVSKERRRGAGQTETQGEVSVARRKDGGLVVRLEDRAAADPVWEDVPPVEGSVWWPADRPVRVRIERSGEGSQAVGRIVVDGLTVAQGFPMRALSSSSSALRVGVCVEGQTGLPADVVVDDVEVVYRVVK
jgi:Tfp pilus assembly protein PilF